MPRKNPLKLFISHSFDHPDKFARIREFVDRHGIQHVDWSIPAWDLLNGPGVQAEIEHRIRRCDRVIVIVTREMHLSPWINLELTWARRYGKPVVGVYEHGQAGAPIPAALAAADPSLIGWRATSLAKAITERLAQLLGPDLLVWRSQFYNKGPGAEALGWHSESCFLFDGAGRVPALEPRAPAELFQITV